MDSRRVKQIALDSGFDLAGIASAQPHPHFAFYSSWVTRGLAGAMGYLKDHRAQLRSDPRQLLPTARSILCVAKSYHGPEPPSTHSPRPWLSRYAWGRDYHRVLRQALERVVERLQAEAPSFDYRICVDTAPLLERSYAASAGLGWIGRNGCLIHQHTGSWIFLAELLLSLELEPDTPVEPHCGTCTRCIDACPTQALQPAPQPGPEYELDARRCISYLTIELRGAIPEELRSSIGQNVFGCDICQDVCPWNHRAALSSDASFTSRHLAPDPTSLAQLTPQEFRRQFQASAVSRAKYSGLLRNLAIAMGNSGDPSYRSTLQQLSTHADPVVAEHARWALAQLEPSCSSC